MTATPHPIPAPMPGQGLRPGDKLDKYEILEQISSGGFSVVWKGYDRLLDQAVAIKQIILDPGADLEVVRERFRNEADLQKRVASSNPHLVTVLDFIEEPRGMFIVMEFVHGMSLEQLMASNPGPMDLRMALGYAAAAAVALEAIHSQGIIHRDLKPSNILITHEGGLKVCDFGLATLIADQATPTVGTVRYMAPELLNSQPADARADIYSLGIILYELLVGRNNFNDAFKVVLRDQRNQSLRWMKWHTNTKIKAPAIKQYNPEIPDSFIELVDRMMAKEPVQRIASAPQLIDTMRRQLQAVQPGNTGGPVYDYSAAAAGGAGMSVGDKTAALPKSRKVLYISLATVGFWVMVALVYFGMQKSEEKAKQQEQELVVLKEYYRAAAIFDGLNENAELDEIEWTVRDASGKEVETHTETLASTPTWLGLAEELRTVNANIAEKKLGRLRVKGHSQAAPILAAIAARGHFCVAMDSYTNGELDQAIEAFEKAEKAGALHPDLIAMQTGKVNRHKTNEKSFTFVENLVNENKLLDAQYEYKKIMDESGRSMSAKQRERWDRLDDRINSRRMAAAITKILTAATEKATTDRSAAIELLEAWLLKNKDNPSRDVTTYLTQLVGASNYEAARTAGREAEANDDLAGAISAFKRAIEINPAAAKTDNLSPRITAMRSQIAYRAGKEAYENENIPEAVAKLREALSYDPDLAAAKAILKSIDSAGQMATLEKLAVAAFQNKEYTKAINLWKQLRDEFDYDPDDAAASIAKAEFLITLDAMEAAWRSGNDDATISACDNVLALDSGNERAALLKTLIETRRLFQSRMAAGKDEFKNGDYASSKRQILKAIKISETIEDLTIRNELKGEAEAFRDEVEYIDAIAKARRDFKLDKFRTAKGWIEVALNHRRTDEAKSLKVQIDTALKKQEAENG